MNSFRSALISLLVLTWLQPILFAVDSEVSTANRPVVRVVYFIPKDRKAEDGYAARLDRVMKEVQRFYRVGMNDNGYGDISFEVEGNSDDAIRIYEVHGRLPSHEYGRNDAEKVRVEVKDALAKQGIDIDNETIIIFQLLLEWHGDRAEEIGPFVGGGGPRGGTAWVYDDVKIDPLLLASRDAGGFYQGPCSLGQFNTHYLGGVIHELGHAFGLPHDCEPAHDRQTRGLSLMGSGNHTYGQELRGEGQGAYLSAASALPLSVHPLFTGKRPNVVPQSCRLEELNASYEDGKLVLFGKMKDRPRCIGLVARNDPIAQESDYYWTVRSYRQELDAVKQVDSDAKEGKQSLLIRSVNQEGNDIAMLRKVAVKPDTRYLLSGWVKTKDVAIAERGGATGANLCVFGRSEISESLMVDQDWTYLAVVFPSGNDRELEISARLGHNGSVATGSAWFDDLVLIEVDQSDSR